MVVQPEDLNGQPGGILVHVANGDDVGVLAVTNTKAFSPMINLLDHATAQDNGQPVVEKIMMENFEIDIEEIEQRDRYHRLLHVVYTCRKKT